MTDRIEAQIDEILATCEGDLRGALKALLLVNELLEFELQQLQARRSARVLPSVSRIHLCPSQRPRTVSLLFVIGHRKAFTL